MKSSVTTTSDTVEQTDLPAVVEGDDVAYTLAFTDDSDTAVDITGWTVYFTVKSKQNDDESAALITKDVSTHSNATGGETTVTLTASDTADITGRNHYDVQVKKGDGTVQTAQLGEIRFLAGVTDRTA